MMSKWHQPSNKLPKLHADVLVEYKDTDGSWRVGIGSYDGDYWPIMGYNIAVYYAYEVARWRKLPKPKNHV